MRQIFGPNLGVLLGSEPPKCGLPLPGGPTKLVQANVLQTISYIMSSLSMFSSSYTVFHSVIFGKRFLGV